MKGKTSQLKKKEEGSRFLMWASMYHEAINIILFS